jgi:acyl carrier protein
MNLILALEEEFGIRFEEAEIASLVSFDIIAATIRAYAE